MIKAHLFTPLVVAATFILGGLIILWVERRRQPPVRVHSIDDMTPLDALKIGLAQCLALVPGTSRSGATIIGGMLFGLSRKAATEFTFFLAIPTLIGAGAYSLFKERALLSLADAPLFGDRPRFLVPERLVVRALAAALRRHARLRALRLVSHRLRHRRARERVDRLGQLGGLKPSGWREHSAPPEDQIPHAVAQVAAPGFELRQRA